MVISLFKDDGTVEYQAHLGPIHRCEVPDSSINMLTSMQDEVEALVRNSGNCLQSQIVPLCAKLPAVIKYVGEPIHSGDMGYGIRRSHVMMAIKRSITNYISTIKLPL